MRYRGFTLTLGHGFGEDEARAVVDRVLAETGDRVQVVMDRPGASGRLFVKGEFRRPHEPLGKRLRAARAIAEGRGYRAFSRAGIDVPEIHAYGAQSRALPRACSLVCTQKIRGRDAARIYRQAPDADVGARVARALAAIHAAGLVHGDAVLRNFVLVPERVFVVDLPRWGRWSADAAESDLALFVGSARKLGADEAHSAQLVEEYRTALDASVARMAAGWEHRVRERAEEYLTYLVDRDRTRPERHAARRESRVRPGPREP